VQITKYTKRQVLTVNFIQTIRAYANPDPQVLEISRQQAFLNYSRGV
jgi:hypothetical protein